MSGSSGVGVPRARPGWRGWWPGVLIALALVVPSALLLDDYGVTWDEAYGDLFFGQRYLSFWTTFDPIWLDFEADPYPAGHRPDLRESPLRSAPQEHFPVAATLGAAVSAVTTSLGLTDPFSGYHALNLLLAALLVVSMYVWLLRREGVLVATASVLLLVTLPRVFYHQMVNIKDFPEMVLFTLTLLAFATAREKGSRGWFAVSGISWGLALGIKANALFLPVIAFVWLLAERTERGVFLRSLVALPVGLVTLVLSWPWLWADPIARLLLNLDYIAGRGTLDVGASQADPVAMILLTTPPLVLLIGLSGVVISVTRWKAIGPVGRLALIWFAVVFGRLLIPGAANFDGVRHFLEIFPPLTILGALLLGQIASASGQWRVRVSWTIVLAATAASVFQIVRLHPFEVLYWNQLAGGTRGAVEREIPQASDYWATSYGLGLEWINENAPAGSVLIVPIAQHTVMTMREERLRRDVTVLPVSHFWTREVRPGDLELVESALDSGRPVFGMTVLRRDWWNEIAERVARGRQVASWRVDGVDALIISRLDQIS